MRVPMCLRSREPPEYTAPSAGAPVRIHRVETRRTFITLFHYTGEVDPLPQNVDSTVLSVFDVKSIVLRNGKCIVQSSCREVPIIIVGNGARIVHREISDLIRSFNIDLRISSLQVDAPHLDEDWVCAICMDNPSAGTVRLVRLRCCNQVMHMDCAKTAWMSSISCPLCRRDTCPFCDGNGSC